MGPYRGGGIRVRPAQQPETHRHVVREQGGGRNSGRGMVCTLQSRVERGDVRNDADFGTRPRSKYADYEEPKSTQEKFDYKAVPNKFYFEVESAGNLEPDAIIQQGIAVMQQKLAGLIHGMHESGEGGGDYAGPRSPEFGGADPWGADQGFTTPYNGGSTTPFGQTPYGNPGGY